MTHPELCADLRQQYIAHQSRERRRLDLIYEEYVRDTISEIVAGGKYPSLRRVISFITMKNPLLTSVHLTGRALKRIRQEVTTSQFGSCAISSSPGYYPRNSKVRRGKLDR